MRISDELSVRDLLNLRLVSKACCVKVAQIELEELSYDFYMLNRSWFSIDQPVRKKIVIPFSSRFNPKYSLVKSSVIFRSPVFNLSALKRLRFAYALMPNRLSALVEHINRLTSLEHLEFLDKHTYGSHLTLRLPQLQILFLYNLVDGCLNVDAPNLRVLHCETHLDKIQLTTPESVRELHVAFFDPELTAYPNVQMLTVQQAHTFDRDLADRLLKHLLQLHELRIQFKPTYSDLNHLNYYSRVDFVKVRKVLSQLLDERERLNGNTAIRFEHLPLHGFDELEQLRKEQFVC